jgi:hypothetical protein
MMVRFFFFTPSNLIVLRSFFFFKSERNPQKNKENKENDAVLAFTKNKAGWYPRIVVPPDGDHAPVAHCDVCSCNVYLMLLVPK